MVNQIFQGLSTTTSEVMAHNKGERESIIFENVFPYHKPGIDFKCFVTNPKEYPYEVSKEDGIIRNGVSTKNGVKSTSIGQITFSSDSIIDITCKFTGATYNYWDGFCFDLFDTDQASYDSPEAFISSNGIRDLSHWLRKRYLLCCNWRRNNGLWSVY